MTKSNVQLKFIEKEISHCIGKKCRAYEISGVVLVENIEEPLLEKLDLNRVIDGSMIFSQLNYEQISSNIANATTSFGDLEKYLKNWRVEND